MTDWLPGYSMIVWDLNEQPIADYLGPTMADCEVQYVNDISLGAIKAAQVAYCKFTWHDQLIEADNPAAELWKKS